jgi:DNA-binding response OmpR family regulator
MGHGSCSEQPVIILVAEDEAIIALMLAMTLDLAGHKVVGPVASVEEGLELAEATRPELALVDIRLSGARDGVCLARSLRDRWGVPSLFISGQTAEARAARDAALGVLGKPYDPGEVIEAVATVGELLAGRWPERCPKRLELFCARGDERRPPFFP